MIAAAVIRASTQSTESAWESRLASRSWQLAAREVDGSLTIVSRALDPQRLIDGLIDGLLVHVEDVVFR